MASLPHTSMATSPVHLASSSLPARSRLGKRAATSLPSRLPHASPRNPFSPLSSPPPSLSNISLLRHSLSGCSASGGFLTRGSTVSSTRVASRGNEVSGEASSETFSRNIDDNYQKQGLVAPTGSVKWILGPLSLTASLLVPQFSSIGLYVISFKDVILSEIFTSFLSEILFYVGLGIFLSIAESVKQPYYEISGRSWSLITDHRSYIYSAYLTSAVKMFMPLIVVYLLWPMIGISSAIAMAPFLLGLALQYALETNLLMRCSPSWPLLPIVFEVYRLYQLNKGAHFIQGLIFSAGNVAGQELIKTRSAVIAMLILLQAAGFACIWSLATFILRLIPSKPDFESV